MTLTMADSIDPNALPGGFDAYAGYVNGNWPDYNAIVARFPNAKHLSISVFLADQADCLDVETGDATPSQAPTFVDERNVAGVYRPCIYSSISVMPQVVAALGNRPRSSYRLWSAHYNHISHICGPNSCAYAGPATVQCDGTQWDSYTTPNIDVSLLSDDFFVRSIHMVIPTPLPAGVTIKPGTIPTATRMGAGAQEGQYDILIVGSDDHLYHAWFSPQRDPANPANNGWGGWEPLS